jgi:hypothetical protein
VRKIVVVVVEVVLLAAGVPFGAGSLVKDP